MRILIAEDDLVSRRLLCHLLRKWNHDVVETGNGLEAWQAFQRDADIQAVVSDWQMPGLDGVELIGRIRGCPGHAYVYIVLLTSKTDREDLIAGMEAGADDFVTKPFDAAELRVRIAAGERVVRLERRLEDQNRRMRGDLEAAAAIQRSLMPRNPPVIEGFRFAWQFIPCEYVAGDLLGIHRLDERHMALFVIDVSGHGVPAAMLSVALSRLLEPTPARDGLLKRSTPDAPHYTIAEPREVLSELNQRFPMALQGNLYHTAVLATLDLGLRKLTVSRSGHPLPLMVRGGKAEMLEVPGGLPAGMEADASYEQAAISLEAGDRILLYSDGVTEAMNEGGDLFGDERFCAAMADTHRDSLEAALEEVVRRIRTHTGSDDLGDDVTILGIDVL